MAHTSISDFFNSENMTANDLEIPLYTDLCDIPITKPRFWKKNVCNSHRSVPINN